MSPDPLPNPAKHMTPKALRARLLDHAELAALNPDRPMTAPALDDLNRAVSMLCEIGRTTPAERRAAISRGCPETKLTRLAALLARSTEALCRVERLGAFLTQQAEAEAASGHDREARDLRALVRFLQTVPAAMRRAANVPEWDNHLTDAGNPRELGRVAATYAAWVEDAGIEHDGACQLAAMAETLAPMLDALDRLHFRG